MSAEAAPPSRGGELWIALASLLGASGVLLAAYGTHALRGRLAPAVFAAWDIAVHYQLLHAVALLGLGLYAGASGRSVSVPATILSAGLALFCGSLYALSGMGWSAAGAIAPIGGMTLLAGWLSLLTLVRRR